jgi:hypothetical protein
MSRCSAPAASGQSMPANVTDHPESCIKYVVDPVISDFAPLLEEAARMSVEPQDTIRAGRASHQGLRIAEC